MWEKEKLYFSGNGWLVVSLFLLQIDWQGHCEKWKSTEECLQMCKSTYIIINQRVESKNGKFGEWGQTSALTLLSYLLSQRKAPWIKGLRRKCEGMRVKMKKTSIGMNCKSWIQMDWNDMTVTSVRYKLVLFPKEGKPCGRNYIELTLFYSLPISRISLLMTDRLPSYRILYFYLLIADCSCLPGWL